MLDFQPVRDKQRTLAELAADLTPADLAQLTNEMIDVMLGLIAACEDEDVTFQPVDPKAFDPYAPQEEGRLAWTLGHVLVHTTASAEEAAFLAAELARGVENHGRSRYETPWPTVTTLAQCRQRLEESRRMRLASLGLWPDEPHLETVYVSSRGAIFNPIARFLSGLLHDDNHLEQIADIVRQADAARHNGHWVAGAQHTRP